jgi:hypothetical protein
VLSSSKKQMRDITEAAKFRRGDRNLMKFGYVSPSRNQQNRRGQPFCVDFPGVGP